MARVEERVLIHSSVAEVWDVLTDWESQPAWMQDAEEVRVVSAHRTGVGVEIECPTNIALGIVVLDRMRVTSWEEQRRIGVVHTGKVIKGSGAFELRPATTPEGEATIFVWSEDIDAPLGKVGDRLASWFAVPYVSFIFRRSLRALKAYAESRAASSPAGGTG